LGGREDDETGWFEGYVALIVNPKRKEGMGVLTKFVRLNVCVRISLLRCLVKERWPDTGDDELTC
jgi:hypothetical protein